MHEGQQKAIRDIAKRLSDMTKWCDQNGHYDAELVSVSQDSLRQLRHCISLVLKASYLGTMVEVPDGYDTIYAYLCQKGK